MAHNLIQNPWPVASCKVVLNISGEHSGIIFISNVHKMLFKEIFEAGVEVEKGKIRISGIVE